MATVFRACYDARMIEMRCVVEELSNADLIAGIRELVRRSREVEADLLVYLGEIDERQLYVERAHPSMHEFCVEELGFSDDVAYSRITVARAARRLPAIVDAIRAGQVHLTGVRLLVPHLTFENHRALLARAAGKTKGEIEELIVTFAPRPPVPDMIRKLPAGSGSADAAATQGTLDGVGEQPSGATQPPPSSVPSDEKSDASPQPELCADSTDGSRALLAASKAPSPELPVGSTPSMPRARRATIAPLAEDAYKFQFTGSRALRNKVLEAQALLRHRVPNGDLASIMEMALDVLIAQVKKERFGVGRKARRNQRRDPLEISVTRSRHVPDDFKRAVYERDDGHCTYVDERGRRCKSRDVEYDHIDGWALSPVHSIDRIRLLCRAHNQHAADKLYGREFMERARGKRTSSAAVTRAATAGATPAETPATAHAGTSAATPAATPAETSAASTTGSFSPTPETSAASPAGTSAASPAEASASTRGPLYDRATAASSAHTSASNTDAATRSGTSSEERLL
jgi:5-methylcytosine-specific restriction endonuclease McrA